MSQSFVLKALEYHFQRIATISATHRLKILAGSILLIFLGVYLAGQTQTDNGLHTFFDENDSAFNYYQEYQREFNSDEIIYLLYKAPDKEFGPFDLEVMQQIAKLTAAIEQEVPFVRKVTSLANAEFISANDDEIVIHDLVYDEPYTQEHLLQIRQIALSKPLYVNNLIDPSGMYGAIVVDMTRTSALPQEELQLNPEFGNTPENLYPYASASVLKELIERQEYTNITFWRSGDVPLNADYTDLVMTESPILTMIMLLLIGFFGLVLFPTTLLGLLAPLTVIITAVILTIAFIGLMDWEMGIMFSMVPTLICALGASQCVHLSLAYHNARQTEDVPQAVKRTIREVGLACFLAAVTTAIGFLGMSGSALKAVSELGVYSSFGVISCFLLSLTLMISLSALSRTAQPLASVKKQPRFSQRWMATSLDKVIAINQKHGGSVILLSSALLLVSCMGASQVKIDYNFLEELKPHVEARQHIEKVESVMGGWISAVYVFDTQTTDGIASLPLLKLIEGFTNYAEQQPLVKKTQHIVEIVKDLNQAFHADDKAWYKLPDDQASLAQLLFLYQMSGGEDINDLINFDSSQTVVQLRITLTNASSVQAVIAELDGYLENNTLPGTIVKKSGIGVLWGKVADYISSSQIQGYTIVFLIIYLFLLIAFGNFKLATLAMLANITPILIAVGAMGFAGMHMDYLTMLVATTAIGIAVDDTIHLVMRYRLEFDRIRNYEKALAISLHKVGPALITTTVILLGAFATYQLSELAVMANFGLILAGTITLALVADLFLLPVLISRFKAFGPEDTAAARERTSV